MAVDLNKANSTHGFMTADATTSIGVSIGLGILGRGAKKELEKAQEVVDNCAKFRAEVQALTVEETEYVIDFEEELDDLTLLQNDLNDEYEELFARIKELEEKEQNGTITEDEQKELEEKHQLLITKKDNNKNTINTKTTELKDKSTKFLNEIVSTVAYKNFGQLALEQGVNLAATETSGSIFKKAAGTDGHAQRDMGIVEITAANYLLLDVAVEDEARKSINDKINDI